MSPELKIDYYDGRVVETGIEIGQQKAVEHTTGIETYQPKIEMTPAEIGLWTGLFFTIIIILHFFFGR